MRSSSVAMLLGLCFLHSVLPVDGSTDDLSKANNAFAFDLYKRLSDENKGKNLFFSPISISTAFGMVNLGARGKTQEQMKTVLHLDKISSDDALNEAFKKLLASFKDPANNYTLHLINRLFGSEVFDFHQKFLEESQKYFEASLEEVDFVHNPEESRRHINDWVAEQTNEKIKDLFPVHSFDANTALVIVNAIYFQAGWAFPFEEENTKPGPFRISKTEQVQMDMMHLSDEYLNYHNAADLGCEILELPYKGDKASMIIFLPRDVDGLPDLEKQLTGEKIIETLSKVKGRDMVVQLPKFLIDQSISLKEFLKLMGMVDLFDEERSDLSGIGGPNRLTVTEALHKAFVNVSEVGTEAAAATGIKVSFRSGPNLSPVRFIVDRPFLFVIYEKYTRSILFMGRLVRPPISDESIGKIGETAALHNSAATMAASVWVLGLALFLLLACWSLQGHNELHYLVQNNKCI